jgi:hypothetical protein
MRMVTMLVLCGVTAGVLEAPVGAGELDYTRPHQCTTPSLSGVVLLGSLP